jgi:calcium-dependent protein kinase
MIGEDGNFGLSKQVNGEMMTATVGSSFYIAPEVILKKYDLKCDVWSLGVILYIFLCRHLPFSGAETTIVFKKIKEGKISFTQREWLHVTAEGKDLVMKMLEYDPLKRFSISD